MNESDSRHSAAVPDKSRMKCFLAVAILAAAATAIPLDFQPSVNSEHPALSLDSVGARIIGGREVPPHGVPYQAALYMGDVLCGGSLISDRYVLTSAQCAALSSRPIVILGAHRLQDKEKEQLILVASKVIIHPHWSTYENDIALVMLPQSVRPTDAIQPIRLAPPESGDFVGKTVRVTGWGVTSNGSNNPSPVLRYILNPIVSNRVCQQKLGISMSNRKMCLSGEERRSPCRGDGGGPVIGEYQNNLVQVGIISFMNEKDCEIELPVGLTSVPFYYQWIISNM